MRAFDGATPVEDILAYVDRVRAAPARREGLVGLLPEQAPIYAGRSASEAERIRGYLLASFETTGLPPAAIDYVLEVLESGLNPYTVAAAAKAMRGAHAVPEQAIPLLLRAIDRIRLADDFVCFDRSTNGDTLTTALMELFRTLAWLGPRASTARAALEAMIEADAATFSVRIRPEIEKALDAVSRLDSPAARSCCASQARSRPAELTGPAHSPLSEVDIRDVELQDQNGAVLSFGEFFHGRPGIM